LWTAVLIATQGLFDAITNTAGGYTGFWDCVIPLITLGAATFSQQILNGLQNFLTFHVVYKKSSRYIGALLYNKLQRIDPALFEFSILG